MIFYLVRAKYRYFKVLSLTILNRTTFCKMQHMQHPIDKKIQRAKGILYSISITQCLIIEKSAT